ncbi:MAG TPA: DNA polymerase III subunit beta [Cryomorphaceae bacterium]|nr:DNA polymerase III subunit beta [Cryomorphaceae bacterium]
MKFIVSSSELLKNLQAIGGVISTNNSLPILDNFLFEVDNDQLTVTVCDLETTMNTTLAVKAEEAGSMAVQARTLMDFLKTLPEQPLTFTINESQSSVEISSSSGKFRMAGYPADEFPKNPELEEDKISVVKMPASVLVDGIQNTLFATAIDEMRPVMSGVYCEFTPEYLRFVATDAHKLVRFTLNDQKADKSSTLILAKKPLNQLKNILMTTSSDVELQFDEKFARFSFDDSVLICRLIDGKYPNYEAVIPKDNHNRLLVDRKALLNAMRRVSIFSNKTTHQVRIRIEGSELSLTTEDTDFSNEAYERLNCSFNGEDMEIGFNSKFLIEMLSSLDTDEVEFHLNGPNRAGILLPVQKEDSGSDILMLVMPVMFNN